MGFGRLARKVENVDFYVFQIGNECVASVIERYASRSGETCGMEIDRGAAAADEFIDVTGQT